MYNSLFNAVLEWNKSTNERQKLQHVYIVLIMLSVIVAGIVALIDAPTGQNILLVTAVAGAIFLANAIIWSLVESVFVARLSGRRKKQ